LLVSVVRVISSPPRCLRFPRRSRAYFPTVAWLRVRWSPAKGRLHGRWLQQWLPQRLMLAHGCSSSTWLLLMPARWNQNRSAKRGWLSSGWSGLCTTPALGRISPIFSSLVLMVSVWCYWSILGRCRGLLNAVFAAALPIVVPWWSWCVLMCSVAARHEVRPPTRWLPPRSSVPKESVPAGGNCRIVGCGRHRVGDECTASDMSRSVYLSMMYRWIMRR